MKDIFSEDIRKQWSKEYDLLESENGISGAFSSITWGLIDSFPFQGDT